MPRSGWASATKSGDCSNIAVVEVNRLVQSTTQGSSVTRKHVVARDLALLNLGYPPLRHTHPISNVLLGEAPAAPDFRKPATADRGEQLLLADPHGLLTPSPLNMRRAYVLPPRVTSHPLPSSSA